MAADSQDMSRPRSRPAPPRRPVGARAIPAAGCEPLFSALEEQRSEKVPHALIAVVSIGVRAGQLDGAGPMPGLSSRLVSHA
jgi:hypothetical protein